MPTSYLHALARASSRRNSEDRAEMFEHGDDLVLLVADGAGGLSGGGVAADAFVEAVRAAVLDHSADAHDLPRWLRLFEDVDAKLDACMQGETTAVIAVVHPAGVLGVSAGDSEAWLVTDRGIDDLTLGQRRARLGCGRAAPMPFRREGLEGSLVVATDGLFKYAPRDKIAAAVRGRSPGEATAHLVELVKLRSGTLQDDVGIVVVALASPLR